MNTKTSSACLKDADSMDLAAAVEQFVALGGVIDIVSGDEQHALTGSKESAVPPDESTPPEKLTKLEHLKILLAKGAGISALQYSLRMNKKDIKQLAIENGLKITFSRPISEISRAHRAETSDIDDTVAGHAMHYSSLGYTAPEIARILDLSVRQVWNIGKAYRFEFKTDEHDPIP
ncbi:hypothetical protein [Pseudomonas viridiflava]|uniref:hypothetical protein n=1 Tax=Pseudomonas viridiflava TaxID=33069 RepID=UPI000F0623A4|nr:hypothetical protein [Pseudomonas viridiflava]